MDDLPFSVVVPTRDSARWLSHFLQAYRRLGIEPFYILDARSSDATESILDASNATYRRFEPKKGFVEGGVLAFAAEVVDTDWILRLDDDEFPSGELLRWAAEHGIGQRQAWGLSRLNLFARDEGIYYSRNACVLDPDQAKLINNPQFRFYEKSSVEYIDTLHTPGFALKDWAYAPTEAHIVHFDALLRPVDERLDKVKRYESSRRGFGWAHADQYLPEFFTLEELEATAYGGDVSHLLADLPLAERRKQMLIDFDDIRQVCASRSSRELHAARLAFASRGDTASRIARGIPTWLTTVPVGEFLCTLARVLQVVGLQAPVKALGSAVFERAMSIKIDAPRR